MQTQAQLDARMAIERAIVQKLIDVALAAGWEIPFVWDGEERQHCIDRQAVLDAVFSVDESYIHFRKFGVARTSVYIVLGNDGYDVIADNSIQETFQAEVMNAVEAFAETFEPQ
jgi:hypothetical protein